MRVEDTDAQNDAPNGIRAILCDVGGVLIHKVRTPALQQWETFLRLQPMALPLAIWLCESARRATLGKGSVDEVWDEVQRKYALTDAERETFRHDFTACDQVDTEFVQFLHMARKTRKIALLSNAWPDAQHVFGEVFGLEALADMMILSCEEGLAKPDRRIYDLAAERLQLPHASIVFIDDYPPHVSAARSCGMQGVIFETREQTIAELQALLGGALPGLRIA